MGYGQEGVFVWRLIEVAHGGVDDFLGGRDARQDFADAVFTERAHA